MGSPAIGLSIKAASWIWSQIEPLLIDRDAERSGDRTGTPSYVLRAGMDGELRNALDLLATVQSVGRSPKGVTHCIALDLYKTPDDGSDPSTWPNTEAGELVSKSKYRGDYTAFKELTSRMATVVTDHPMFAASDLVLTIPGRLANGKSHGERLAMAVAALVDKTCLLTKATYVERDAAKEGFRLESGHVEIPGAVEGMSILIIDDVMRSGNSLGVIAQGALSMGATSVLGLVAAKTLRN